MTLYHSLRLNSIESANPLARSLLSRQAEPPEDNAEAMGGKVHLLMRKCPHASQKLCPHHGSHGLSTELRKVLFVLPLVFYSKDQACIPGHSDVSCYFSGAHTSATRYLVSPTAKHGGFLCTQLKSYTFFFLFTSSSSTK